MKRRTAAIILALLVSVSGPDRSFRSSKSYWILLVIIPFLLLIAWCVDVLGQAIHI